MKDKFKTKITKTRKKFFKTMQKKVILLASLILGLTFVTCLSSCNNDDDNNSSAVPNTLTADQIVGKWVISDSSSPYASFEFTEDGHYIVVENTADMQSSGTASESAKNSLLKPENVKASGRLSAKDYYSLIVPTFFYGFNPYGLYGTYTIEGNTIILSGFGTIEANSIPDENFQFSVTLEATGESYDFVARQAAPVSSSAKTDLLCSKAWVILGTVSSPFNYDFLNGTVVLFSKTGSYLILSGGEEGSAALAEWKWTDGSETAFYYSGNSDSGIDSPDAKFETIEELTNDTLVLTGEDLGITFTYYLVPQN